MPHELLDEVGQTYGRLTLLAPDGRGHGNRIYWRCKCSCGGHKTVRIDHLRSSKIVSCGCYRLDKVRDAHRTHGHAYPPSPEYKAWLHAKARCENPKDKKYKHYGARGIKMCEEWRNDFAAFYAHIGVRPPGMTLDRIEVNGHYEPGNVRWADHFTQARNRRPFHST